MKKEEIYLDLTKLTNEQLKQVAESVKDEMYIGDYDDLHIGFNCFYNFLKFHKGTWFRSNDIKIRIEITLQDFLNNFGIMNETEKKLYDYAVSVDWDYNKIHKYIGNPEIGFTFDEYESLEGDMCKGKATNFIKKHKPQQVESITLPIEDYNRLRKLELKAEIKRLKKEYKKL